LDFTSCASHDIRKVRNLQALTFFPIFVFCVQIVTNFLSVTNFILAKMNHKIRKLLKKIFNWIFVASINFAISLQLSESLKFLTHPVQQCDFCIGRTSFVHSARQSPLNFKSHTPHESAFTKLRNAERLPVFPRYVFATYLGK